jgi:hypothetical protein
MLIYMWIGASLAITALWVAACFLSGGWDLDEQPLYVKDKQKAWWDAE